MERRYKILIAEDEPIILAGLKLFAGEWGRAEEPIGEASNGKEALEKCLAAPPDIVISDIRMPGMDGIQMLDEIRKAGLETKIIFYSGYAEFEYAREAVRLGAFDYLLKPIQQENLWKVLDAAAEEIASHEEKYDSIQEKKSQMEAVLEALWMGNKIDFEQFEKNIKLEFPEEKFQILAVQSIEDGDTDFGEPDKIYGIFDNIRYCRIGLGKNKMALVLNLPEELSGKEALDMAEELLGTRLKGGSSRCAGRKERVSVLMEEAEVAFATSELIGGSRIVVYQTSDDIADFIKRRILEGILENDGNKAGAVIEYLWGALQREEIMLTQAIDIYNELLTLLLQQDRYYDQYEKADVNCIREIIHTKSDMYHLFMNLYKQKEIESRNTEMTVYQVIKDMEQNFREELTLSSLSEKYHISISHLSAMIKRETGHTFTEHITNLRIESAKELLAQGNITVSEVIELVGYHDYFYFLKLFKKCVGVTPSKYRKMLESEKMKIS